MGFFRLVGYGVCEDALGFDDEVVVERLPLGPIGFALCASNLHQLREPGGCERRHPADDRARQGGQCRDIAGFISPSVFHGFSGPPEPDIFLCFHLLSAACVQSCALPAPPAARGERAALSCGSLCEVIFDRRSCLATARPQRLEVHQSSGARLLPVLSSTTSDLTCQR